jgi:hypothetical protein
MLAWLIWRLDQLERLHAVARALMGEFGAEAYAEARRRERDAQSDATTRDWARVAQIVARSRSRREEVTVGQELPTLEIHPAGEPALSGPEQKQPFRIQFVCGTVDRGATNVTEKPIQAADASAAIIAAANTRWPPQTIGLRILDRKGHEVFAREKGQKAAHKLPAS